MSACQKLLELKERKLPGNETMRLIRAELDYFLCDILSKACARQEIHVHALHDSQTCIQQGETHETWELLARWRVWLVIWGHCGDELASGTFDQMEDGGDVLTVEEIGEEMASLALEAEPR